MTTSESTLRYPTVLTTDCIEAGDEDVVDANVNVVNAMYQELLNSEEIAPNALRSYYVDFYLTQSLGGGFAQYVFTAPDREDLDTYIREGLEGMGATAHLELFNRTVETFDALTEDDAEAYLDGDLDTEEESTAGVQAMEELDGEFEALLETEDINVLNAAWLRGQEGRLALNEEELSAHIAQRVAQIPDLEERQAEAEAEERENAPEFEVIIRELCDVAGYALQKITMGDPNYEHNGETILAWHFTTDHGDFIMVEDDEEAYMINAETKEIVAAVEFEEADELVEA
ncbi:DMP19 family protein [Pseudarthrobacter sp. N5]|uniref:DMP19 family protein n=1 Tax=Pseudarthrobacter sp. N5 TaxID=3418416 RepID=UPI003CF912FC